MRITWPEARRRSGRPNLLLAHELFGAHLPHIVIPQWRQPINLQNQHQRLWRVAP